MITGMYNAKLLDSAYLNEENSQAVKSDVWTIVKNPGLFTKMIKLWTKTLAIRNRGSLQLNFKQSALMAMIEGIMSPFLSQKMKDRRKRFGADWIENNDGLILKDGIPKLVGGNMD